MSKHDQKLTVLARVDLFAGCSTKELKQIAKLVTQIDVEAGRVLVREGEPGAEAFVISEGTASVTIAGTALADLGPGAVLGEMGLLDRQLRRSATVTTTSPASLLVLDAGGFGTLLDQHPSVVRAIAVTLAQRLHAVEATS